MKTKILLSSLLCGFLIACGGGGSSSTSSTDTNKTIDANKTDEVKIDTDKTDVNQTEETKTEEVKTDTNQTKVTETEATKTDTNQTGETKTEATKTTSLYPKVQDRYKGMQWNLFEPDERYLNSPFNVSKEANAHFGDYHRKYRGKGVKIAVIDSGLDVNHEDLSGAVTKTYDLQTGGVDVSGTSEHGTGVVGIIAARANEKGIFGVASESDILFLRFKREMKPDEIVKLFEKADEFGADIINCSWGSGEDNETGEIGVSDEVKAKIVDLAKNGRDGKGTIIVFASGNTNEDINTLNLEANIPEVISVGSSNEQNIKASMSNFGENLDILAPGGDYGFSLGVPTLAPKNETTLAKGTSVAAPLVSGAIALMLEKNPNLTRAEVENLLKSTADKIGDEAYINGRNNNYGYGKINIEKLLDAVK